LIYAWNPSTVRLDYRFVLFATALLLNTQIVDLGYCKTTGPRIDALRISAALRLSGPSCYALHPFISR
jgi:hypothetical protein